MGLNPGPLRANTLQLSHRFIELLWPQEQNTLFCMRTQQLGGGRTDIFVIDLAKHYPNHYYVPSS